MESATFEYWSLWLSFVFCMSLTAAGILVIFNPRQPGSIAELSYLKYYLISAYVFGYYSLWSKILFPYFLSIENIEYLAAINSHMGIPFFVVSLVMLLIWALRIQKRATKLVVFPISVTAIIAGFVSLRFGESTSENVRAAYSIAGFMVYIIVSGITFSGKDIRPKRNRANLLITLIICAGLIHLTFFTDLVRYRHYEIVFVFLFFLLNTATVVIYIYSAAPESPRQNIDDFLAKHRITKREADIIQGIYAGKTNQEIADQLFITLQTVKDHSSRIYQKTQVRNRTQLTALLRESQYPIL